MSSKPLLVKRRRIYWISLILISFILATLLTYHCLYKQSKFHDKYQIHFIDVGQGDAILVITPHQTILIDGGPRNSNVYEYLINNEINEIDILIATHPHADHIGGLIKVLELFTVNEIIDSGIPHSTLTYNNYLTLIDQKDIPFTIGRRGLQRSIGEKEYIHILHPANPSSSNLNNVSVVVKIILDEISLLLTGDIEMVIEQDLLNNSGLLQADILKVAHHGSSTSSSINFLKAVSPIISIIMCGNNNQYGHPDPEILQRLETIDSEIYRTDIHGNILIQSDGKTFSITTQKIPHYESSN